MTQENRGTFHDEVQRGDRFEFGANWSRFLAVVDDDRIREAERSLVAMLGEGGVEGRTFLDAGSGSGLFSLAAMRLGAARVHSFDFDPQSVACTAELRARYFPGDDRWVVEEGSVLDGPYLDKLGEWDLVYSWGVLHHTGAMYEAIGNVSRLVAPDGRLFISIYNDQGLRTKIWRRVKRNYNRVPARLQPAYVAAAMAPRELMFFTLNLVARHPGRYVKSWTDYKRQRGMSRWHDLVDWVGGYPFEVAKTDQIFDFVRSHGFSLERLFSAGTGLGCNQFVFRRDPSP